MSATDSAAGGAARVSDPRPGRVLADARVRKNLSLAEVAQQLRLSVAQIESLEADAYDRLPGPVFVRGFVRNYARVLELDGDQLVAALNLPHESVPASSAVPHSDNIPFPEQNPVNWRAYVAGLLALAGSVALYEFFIAEPPTVVVSSPSSRPVAAPVVAAPVPLPEAEVTAAPAQAAPEAVAAEPAAAVPPPATAVVPAPAPVPAVATVPAPDPAPAQGKRADTAEMHFVFEAQSWVEVRDRNDRVLFSQLNPAGAEQHLQGRPPLSVVVGNARGVHLTYNGRPFDLAPHTRVEVARFTLE